MARRLPKSEGRDPKAERNPKPEGDGKRRELSVFEIRTFGLLSAFGFRPSDSGGAARDIYAPPSLRDRMLFRLSEELRAGGLHFGFDLDDLRSD